MKKFELPEIEIIEVDNTNIVTASGALFEESGVVGKEWGFDAWGD